MIPPAPDPVRLTEELVSFDTVSSRSNAALCARVSELLAPLGAELHEVRKPSDEAQLNLLARFGPPGPGGLALAGHTDTVPWDDSMRATTASERDGRRLYGRGTCDMKGAISAMICATAAVDRSALRKPLWLAFTFEEEIGCHGARLLAATRPLPVEHCIIGEPTGLRPVTLHKGYATMRVEFIGSPCHSSDPDQGASAVHAASRAIDALINRAAEWKQRADPDTRLRPPWTTMNVGLVQGGSARNVVPERAFFWLETRPVPEMDRGALLQEIREVIAAAVASVPGVRYSLDNVVQEEAFRTPEDAAVVRWLVDRTGSDVCTVPFYTEGPFFNRMGAQTVVCGPGEIAQAHRVDEWVELDALEAAADLYRAAIEEFCT